jgi:small subunit ribosomal protein S17
VRSDAGHVRSGEERRDIGVSESEGMTENVRTSHRKTREGRVVSDKMDKTVVVAVEDRVKHSLYGKVIRRTNKLKAHDATNAVTIGDRVLIMETRLREAKEELFNLRFQMATGQLDNNRRLRTVRHDIARIYTILRERELGLSVAPNEQEVSA